MEKAMWQLESIDFGASERVYLKRELIYEVALLKRNREAMKTRLESLSKTKLR